MNASVVPDIFLLFITFCRVGGCLMLVPGYSSTRIPMRIRLYIAFAVTATIAPLVMTMNAEKFEAIAPTNYIGIIISESGFGMLVGLLARCFFLALQFMAIAVANFIGLGTLPGAPLMDNEPAPPLTSLIMLIATLMLVLTDMHIEMLRALIDSYAVVPLATPFDVAYSLERLTNTLTDSFRLALQVCSPFAIFGIVVNLMLGLVNKMIPQIPIYFISLPFVIAGGLALTYATLMEFILTFLHGFSVWLKQL